MPNDTSPKIGALSFLVIDDEPFVQKLAVRILGIMGATDIETASNGVEALANIDNAATQPDVLLVDLNMPDMGGAELLRHLADRNYSGAIVIVSSADEEILLVAEGIAKYRQMNVLGHITKPITQETLTEVLGNRTGL